MNFPFITSSTLNLNFKIMLGIERRSLLRLLLVQIIDLLYYLHHKIFF